MAKKTTARGPQVWETKWVQVQSMDHNHDNRKHLCVVVAVEGDTLTLLPTSTKPVEDRPNQRPVLWGGVEVYAATNRIYSMTVAEWNSFRKAEARYQTDKEVRGYLKQELARA
jgi:hypothetical protein